MTRCSRSHAVAHRFALVAALVLAGVRADAQTAPSPAPRGAWLTGAYFGFAMTQALDVQSTSHALGRGAYETNPLMRPCVGSMACASAAKTATTAGIFWIVDTKIRPRSRTAAILTMAALTTVQAIVVARNYQVAR